MAMRVRYKGNFSVKKVVKQISVLLVTLYVGGTIVNELGDVMNGTSSPFYQGLELIGWTVDANGLITDTTGSGVLTVIGLIGIGAIVLSYLDFSF